MKVAIVGGGLSAYLLAYRLRGESKYTVDIFEDPVNAGGNCHTCQVVVPGTAGGSTFNRWADLAVNDFNAPMYREVVDIIDALGVEYAPLEDTASFYTTDGTVGYTLDGGWGTPAPEAYEHLYTVFAARAWDVMHGPNASTYANMTVAQFLASEEPFKSAPDFATSCVLARVNAMYFCADAGPANMPIQTAYLYYLFQEGFGTDDYATPNGPVSMINRQYFKNGAASFVAALKAAAVTAGANIYSDGVAQVLVPGASQLPSVTQNETQYGPYDAVVLTCHADDARAALPAGYDAGVLKGILGSVNYTASMGYVHQDTTLVPAPELRRTYNVWIRNASEPQNYSMTYVINQHQADRFNTDPSAQYFGCGEYYVSLDPPHVPSNILVDPSGKKAVWGFRHNVGDTNLVAAQTALWGTSSTPGLQGLNNIYFVGGWTVGAGLMVECWNAVKELVEIWDQVPPEVVFDESRPVGQQAPRYLRGIRAPKSGVTLSRGKPPRR